MVRPVFSSVTVLESSRGIKGGGRKEKGPLLMIERKLTLVK